MNSPELPNDELRRTEQNFLLARHNLIEADTAPSDVASGAEVNYMTLEDDVIPFFEAGAAYQRALLTQALINPGKRKYKDDGGLMMNTWAKAARVLKGEAYTDDDTRIPKGYLAATNILFDAAEAIEELLDKDAPKYEKADSLQGEEHIEVTGFLTDSMRDKSLKTARAYRRAIHIIEAKFNPEGNIPPQQTPSYN